MATHSSWARRRRRYIDYPLQAAGLALLYGLFAALPVDWASAAGGWIGRTLGPRLGATKKARRNLERAMPELTPERRQEILLGMWDNLGRVITEYPHLDTIWRHRTEQVGTGIFRTIANEQRPSLVFSGHLANWEIDLMAVTRNGMPVTAVYRHLNNPLVGRLMERPRAATGAKLVPKGREGARAIMATLNARGSVCMLVDQKMNDGIPVPFFGRDAMTAPAIAQMALRFDCPIIPVRAERLGGVHLRMTAFPPLDLPRTGNREADIRATMVQINKLLEDWVRARPEQWLWLHRRWPD
jgi:Kdo2-lipid IVA lauroyltransferase/acyltransferase